MPPEIPKKVGEIKNKPKKIGEESQRELGYYEVSDLHADIVNHLEYGFVLNFNFFLSV